MKIGFVLDDTLDTPDGVQQYVLLLGNWLQQQGHEVHYITTASQRDDVQHLHAIGRNLRIKFNKNVVPFVLPTSPRKIAAVLEHEQFDILHIQLPYHPGFGARVISLAPPQTAIVGTFHIAPYSATEQTLTRVLGYWMKPTKPKFDAVMSVSKPAQKLAQESFGLRSQIVPNMVDVASFRLGKSLNHHAPPKIIFLGRLVPRKGCEHFIKSLALLQQPFQATIIGDGNQRAKLEQLVASHQLDRQVTFAGFVSEAKKRKLLSQADMAVFPATGGESFGIVLIEAMAAGSCVVLAGNNPGYSSVMGSLPQALFDPTNHAEFAETMTRYLENQAAASKLYAAQQQLVQQYDVETVGAQVIDVYNGALAKRQVRSHNKRQYAASE